MGGDTLRYLYLPRLKDREVLAQAIRTGAASRDFFGIAYAQSGDSFEGFQFGIGGVQLDDTLLLIEPEVAKMIEEAGKRPSQPISSNSTETGRSATSAGSDSDPGEQTRTGPKPGTRARLFHGTAEIASATAKMRIVELAEEILSVLAGDPNTQLRITVEIAAEFPNGAADHVRKRA